jgi:endonuclease/exonuclease/phosphatase (EEP) superfamily protein YafD
VPIPYFNGRIRRMPVVHLSDRASGAQVTFVNVHNPADTGPFQHQGRWRDQAVTREIARVRELSGATPVILTGDLNDRHDAFCRLTSAGGMASSAGGTGYPCRPPARAGIDWIMGSSPIVFSEHTVDRGPLVRATTDHPIVVARAKAIP